MTMAIPQKRNRRVVSWRRVRRHGQADHTADTATGAMEGGNRSDNRHGRRFLPEPFHVEPVV